MRKTILIFLATVAALSPGLALDINQASEAELDGLLGIGPAVSRRILDARANAPFRSWEDLIARVAGIGANKAIQLSAAGLSVAGTSRTPVPVRPSAERFSGEAARAQ